MGIWDVEQLAQQGNPKKGKDWMAHGPGMGQDDPMLPNTGRSGRVSEHDCLKNERHIGNLIYQLVQMFIKSIQLIIQRGN